MSEADTPPTVSEWDDSDSLGPARPRWPKVVGIISIVWGSLSLLCGVCGTAWATFGVSMVMPADQKIPPTVFISPAQLVLTAVSTMFAVVLIVAGATTVGRKPVGRVLHLVYASAAVLIFLIGIPLAIQQQAVAAQWVQDNPENPVAKSMTGAGGSVGQIVGWVFGGIIGLGYPGFCLVWFGLVKRKPDSMGSADAPNEPAA